MMRQFVLEVSADGVPTIKNEIVQAPPAPTPVPEPTTGLMRLHGVNLCGGGTDWTTWGDAGPVAGTHYKWAPTDMVDKLIAAGVNVFRVPFAWEALQSSAFGLLGYQVGNYKAYGAGLYALVDYITGKGAQVILDIHGERDAGFAAYHDVKVGSSYNGNSVSDMLADLWLQLAVKYKTNLNVLYGITNEPHDIPGDVWYAAAQRCVTAIRTAGATTRIYVPGIDWTGAGTWMTHNAPLYNIVDPLNNTGVQLHLYLDASSGGGSTGIVNVSIGATRCRLVTEWARSKGLKLFLAEVGLSASNAIGPQAWANLYAYLATNRDVWDGFAFWAAGHSDWWGGYQFYCGPGSKQLAMIQSALK